MRLMLVGCIMFLLDVGLFAQSSQTFRGKVLDASTREPLIGVSVLEKGTTNGVVTDVDGNFVIHNVKSGATITFSYVGYSTQEILATRIGNTVLLEEDDKTLNEVVVIGYGAVKKSDLTGSVAALKPDSKNKGVVVNPQDMLAGKVAGVNITGNDGAPGAGAQIRIRGGSSLNASNDPLIVIDGLAMDRQGVKGSPNALSMVTSSQPSLRAMCSAPCRAKCQVWLCSVRAVSQAARQAVCVSAVSRQ